MSIRVYARLWVEGWPAFVKDIRGAVPEAIKWLSETVKTLALTVWPMFVVPAVNYLWPLPYDYFKVMYVVQALWILLAVLPVMRGRQKRKERGEN